VWDKTLPHHHHHETMDGRWRGDVRKQCRYEFSDACMHNFSLLSSMEYFLQTSVKSSLIQQLKKPIEANKSLYVVTAKRCQQAITKKAVRLRLEVVVTEPSVSTTTIKIKLPKETPNVEDASKLLADISSSKFPILESDAQPANTLSFASLRNLVCK